MKHKLEKSATKETTLQDTKFSDRQKNAGILGLLPNELITKEIGNALSYTDMGKLRQTCLFFRDHLSLKEAMKKKLSQWEIITTGSCSYFRADNGHVYTLGDLACNNPVPVYLSNKKPIIKIFPGYSHTFYLDIDGGCHVNGFDCFGELGLGSNGKTIGGLPVPINLANNKPIVEIVAGYYISFFRDSDGNWYGCGSNREGQLGLNRGDFEETPQLISLPANQKIIRVVTGHSHTFFQSEDGQWFGCGYNGNGQLGVKTNTNYVYTPIQIDLPNHKPIVDIVVGHNYTFILDNEGNCYGCGENSSGQLGISDGIEIHEPTLISRPSHKPIIEVVAGGGQSFFRDADGDWYGCGNNHCGQLGIDSSKQCVDKPIKISLPNNESIIRIIAGVTHTFFFDAKNNWYGSGQNRNRQLGLEKKVSEQFKPMLIEFNQFEKEIEPSEKYTPMKITP